MTQWSDCCDLYEATIATAEGLRGLRGVYILGSLCNRNEQIAITRQQVRALNLVQSLIMDHRLGRGGRLCVVGAGAAGLTAAAYARTFGVYVTVLESRMALWNLRGCHTRWLHPNLFPRWPNDGWDVTSTNFPVMNWYADYADRVGALLWAKFQSYAPSESVVMIDPATLDVTGNPLEVSWTRRTGQRDLDQPFDAVILAVGFGSEARMRDATASVYWIDDALERANPHSEMTRYLVSGTGDGGLTDLLRLRIDDFRHHHLRELLIDIIPRSVIEQVVDIERKAEERFQRAQAVRASTVDADRYLTDKLTGLLRRETEQSSRSFPGLRDDTQVVLTGRNEYPLSPRGAWPVSRFLAALLLARDPQTQYYSSLQLGTRLHSVVGYDGHAPVRFHMATDRGKFLRVTDEGCELEDDPRGRDFEAVVYRHGTEHVIKSLLRRFRLPAPVIEGLEQKWTQEWVNQGPTSQPMAWGDASHDYGRRNRNHSVRPPVPGRTPIGLLSRLLSIVDPGHRVPVIDSSERLPVLRTDLVTDVLALQVAAIGERLDGGSHLGWRMGGEVDLQPVIQAIRTIDASLDCLVDKANCAPQVPICQKCRGLSLSQRRVELETHWILPRASWSSPGSGELLLQVVAARAWSSRRLRYISNPRRFPDRLPRTTLPARDLFVVIDFSDSHLRVVWAEGHRDDDLRLARELGASLLINKSERIELQPSGPYDT